MITLLAAAPLLFVLVAMTALRWSAALAGAVGLGLALLLAATAFDIAPGGALPLPAALAGILAEATHATATILWIILPALTLYEYQQRSGALERFRTALSGASGERTVQALLIAFFFGLFLEGAAGFGTPVALAAPLLVGIGFSAVRAVTLALVGHAAGVSFGAVDTPVLAQIEISALPPLDLAAATAFLNLPLVLFLPFALVVLAAGRKSRRHEAGLAGLAGLGFVLPYIGLAMIAGPELPTLAGALIGLVPFVLIVRRRRGMMPFEAKSLLPDLLPYLLLVGLVLATRLIPALREALAGLVLRWDLFGAFGASFAPLFHPGTLLVLSLESKGVVRRAPAQAAPAAMQQQFEQMEEMQDKQLAQMAKQNGMSVDRMKHVMMLQQAQQAQMRIAMMARMNQEGGQPGHGPGPGHSH